MPGLNELEDKKYLLLVQVKHKKGRDEGDPTGVTQLAKTPTIEGEVVVRRVLFSSADEFTEECIRQAEANEVTLICGEEAGLFLIR